MGIIDPKSENRKNLLVFISIMVIGIGIFTAYIIWGTLPLDKILDYEVVAVSYTHLTLPTKRIV